MAAGTGIACATSLDIREVLRHVEMSMPQALSRAGAYIRKSARNAIRKTKRKPSRPGTPPHTRHGKLRNAIAFKVEKNDQDVIVGPTYSGVGLVMTAHEYGQKFHGRNYPKRPLMEPTLRKVLPKLPDLWKNSVK